MVPRPILKNGGLIDNQGWALIYNPTIMKIIKNKTPISEIQKIAEETFGDLVKAVVDIEKKIMVIGGELHSDEEALLLEKSSKQKDLWGINIYPKLNSQHWIEFDSMINLRPATGNRSRGVDDPKVREKIIAIVTKLVEK